MSKIMIGIRGTLATTDKKYNPATYCSSEKGNSLLWKLCHGPLSTDSIDRETLDGLLFIEAVRLEGEKCYINFPCFLREDIELLRGITEKYAVLLGKEIANISCKIKYLLKQVKYFDVDIRKLAFFVIGCAYLDWQGLKTLEDIDLIPKNTVKPGGNFYSLVGHESKDSNIKEYYWGSRSMEIADHVLTSFGDDECIRDCFPDIIIKMYRKCLKDMDDVSYINELSEAYDKLLEIFGTNMIDTLLHRRNTDDANCRLLEKLKYIKDSQINIPIITSNDKPVIIEIFSLLSDVTIPWLQKSYELLRYDLKDLNPVKNGVEYKAIFVQLWHYVFGGVNKYLSKTDLYLDPYAPESEWKGYIPALHDASLHLCID